MYDIAIIGAGPSGSMLARLIGEQYKVLLIDKRNLLEDTSNKNKCCGGLLAPDAQKTIARLGLGIPKEILVDPQLFAVRTIDMVNDIERYYQRFYFNMDREKFDRWLVSIISNKVDKKFNAIFKNFERVNNTYKIKYLHKGNVEEALTKVIVGADGAFSKVRRNAFGDRVFPKTYISIQEWFEREEDLPYFTAVFDENISDFYSWVIPKDQYIILGGALQTTPEAREKFELLKNKLIDKGFSLGNRIKTEGAYIYRPTSTKHIYTGRDNIALVGEAAGLISPSSAEGFSYGLKSAMSLAKSLKSGIQGFEKRYEKNIKGIKLNIIFKNIKSPAMYNPTLRKLAMKSGLQSMKKFELY